MIWFIPDLSGPPPHQPEPPPCDYCGMPAYLCPCDDVWGLTDAGALGVVEPPPERRETE